MTTSTLVPQNLWTTLNFTLVSVVESSSPSNTAVGVAITSRRRVLVSPRVPIRHFLTSYFIFYVGKGLLPLTPNCYRRLRMSQRRIMSSSQPLSTTTPALPSTVASSDGPNAPEKPQPIRLNIPPRYYLLPGSALIAGTTIGLLRGTRKASLRFLAENAHRPPTTVQGWYFYNKTKNYRVILGGIKGAAADAFRLGTTATGWVAIEEGCNRAGLEDFAEVAAGVGTAGVFSVVCECQSRILLFCLLHFRTLLRLCVAPTSAVIEQC